MNKALVVLSGGQDSTTCLYSALHTFDEVHAITFDYGQRHRIELDAAAFIAKHAEVNVPGSLDIGGYRKVASHEVIKLGDHILKSTSPLVSHNELEQYASHQVLPGGVEKTFVPMRNQLFLTIAANRAYALGCKIVVTGVCQEDFGGYPDCRQTFIDAFKMATALGSFNDGLGDPQALQIYTPLMNLTKAQSVAMAINLPGCYGMLAFSHTSYDGQFPPVGKDHATLLRAKGFEEADIPDPLVLRAYKLGIMALPNTLNYRDRLVKHYINHMYSDLEPQCGVTF